MAATVAGAVATVAGAAATTGLPPMAEAITATGTTAAGTTAAGEASGRAWASVRSTSWGLNALYNPLYAYSYGMSSYFPTWGAYDYSTWGLASVASPWLYEDYANPYYAPVTQTTIVQQPVPVPADPGCGPRDSSDI